MKWLKDLFKRISERSERPLPEAIVMLVDECQRLKAENDILIRALEFYGAPDSWPAYYAGAPSAALKDRGLVARVAARPIDWSRP